jgi:tripartite-type tricarboxylate transporter receptor subunit TctC
MKKGLSTKWVLLGLLLAFTFVVASSAGAQALKPLADGFPKRALTIVVVDDPGTRDDIYAKTMQQALTSISPVPVMVSDEPLASGGTFHKMQELQRREGGKDGYYPVVVSSWGPPSDLLVEPLGKELGVDLSDVSMVIRTESQEKAILQRKNAPWGPTFAGMVKYGKANPGKLRYISREVGSGFDIIMEWILQEVGVKVEKIPMGAHEQIAATVGAGQGDFCLSPVQVALTNWQAGKVDVTVVTGPVVPPPWDKDPNCVSSDKAGLPKVALGTILGIGVPKGVPKEHVDWLFNLFKGAASTDVYKNYTKMIPAVNIGILNPAEANAEMKKIYEICDPVVRALGMHWEQTQKK